MSSRSAKVLKRKKKQEEHIKYLKSLFAKHGHGLELNSKREAPGNKYWDSLQSDKLNKEQN